ncbi:MAG: hypothetical protein ABEK16_03785 [Candidatus Nanohalobium sp.]
MALEGPFQVIASRENLILTLIFFGGYLYIHYLRNEYGPKVEFKQLDILVHSAIASTVFGAILILTTAPLFVILELKTEIAQNLIALGILSQGIILGYKLKIDQKLSEAISSFNEKLHSDRLKISKFLLTLIVGIITMIISLVIHFLGLGSIQNIPANSGFEWLNLFVVILVYIYTAMEVWDFFVDLNRNTFEIQSEK